MRWLWLLLAVAGCSASTPVPTDPCAQYADSIYGCAELPPPVVDSLLPWPDSVAP